MKISTFCSKLLLATACAIVIAEVAPAKVTGPDGYHYEETSTPHGYDFTIGDIYYKILLDEAGNDTGTLATVAGAKEYKGNVVIPAEVKYGGKMYKVTMINGFQECAYVTSVTIPEHVRMVCDFYGRYKNSGNSGMIKAHEVPRDDEYNPNGQHKETSTVTVLPHLKEIIFKATECEKCGLYSSIWSGPYDYWTINSPFPNTVEKIVIGDNVKILPDCAFYQCKDVKEFTIPRSVEKIGKYVFGNTIVIPTIFYNAERCVDVDVDCMKYANLVMGNNVKTYNKLMKPYFEGKEFVEIPQGVEALGGLFNSNKTLRKITLPESMTSISDSEFQWCSNLSEVSISSKCVRIGRYTFNNCSSLRCVTYSGAKHSSNTGRASPGVEIPDMNLPSTLQTIANYAFENCKEIASVVIPASVDTIGMYAFRDCSGLRKVQYDAIDAFLRPDDPIYNVGTNYPRVLPAGIEEITFGSNVKTIPHWLASYTNISEITIPESVTFVGDGAFAKCPSLKKVNMNAPNCSLEGDNIFNWWNVTELKFADNVKHIDKCFAQCAMLRKVVLPRKLQTCGVDFSLKSYLDSVDFNCENFTGTTLKMPKGLSNITFGPYVKQIPANLCDNCCINLMEISLGDGIVRIGANAFSNCSRLTKVKFGNAVENIGSQAFFNCGLDSINLPNSVVSVGQSAFDGCSDARYIHLPESLASVGDYAFRGMGYVTKLRLSANLTQLSLTAVEGCKLDSLTIDCKKLVFCDYENPGALDAFANIRVLTLSENAGSSGHVNIECLNEVNIPKIVYNARNSVIAFGGIGHFDNFNVLEIGDAVESLPECFLEDSKYSCKEFVVPSNVKKVGACAFRNAVNIKTIRIKPGVEELGKDCFESTSERKIIIEDSDAPIKSDAFSRVTHLYLGRNVDYTGSPESLDRILFWGNTQEMELGDKVSELPQWFTRHDNLSKFIFGNGMTNLPENMFGYCSALTEVKLPENLKTLTWRAFAYCTSLKTIEIPESVEEIGPGVFEGDIALEKVKLSSALNKIGGRAFYECSSLKAIDLPASLERLGYQVFENIGLQTIISRNPEPPICGVSAFELSDCDACTLYVPGESIERYREAGEWERFKNIKPIPGSETLGQYPEKLFVMGDDGWTPMNDVVLVREPDRPVYHATTNRLTREWRVYNGNWDDKAWVIGPDSRYFTTNEVCEVGRSFDSDIYDANFPALAPGEVEITLNLEGARPTMHCTGEIMAGHFSAMQMEMVVTRYDEPNDEKVIPLSNYYKYGDDYWYGYNQILYKGDRIYFRTLKHIIGASSDDAAWNGEDMNLIINGSPFTVSFYDSPGNTAFKLDKNFNLLRDNETVSNTLYLTGDFNNWGINDENVMEMWSPTTLFHIFDGSYGCVVSEDNVIGKDSGFKIISGIYDDQIGSPVELETYVEKNKINKIGVGTSADNLGALRASEDLSDVRIIAHAVFNRLTILDRDEIPVLVSATDGSVLDVDYDVQGDLIVFDASDENALASPWCVRVGDFYIDMRTYAGNEFRVLGNWVESIDDVKGFAPFVGTVTIDMSTLSLAFSGCFGDGIEEMYARLLLYHFYRDTYTNKLCMMLRSLITSDFITYTTVEPISIGEDDYFKIDDNEGFHTDYSGYLRLGASIGSSGLIFPGEPRRLVNLGHNIYAGAEADAVYPVFTMTDHTLELQYPAGIDDVESDFVQSVIDAPAVYYNLQGIEVKHPVAGQIYIVRRGTTVEKVLYRE